MPSTRLLPPILALLAASCGCGDDEEGKRGPNDDFDGDGITNADESMAQNLDTDADLYPDFSDYDSDQDAIRDEDEAGDDALGTPPVDTDGDGTPDFQDADSDDDLIDDIDETGDEWEPVDTDGDGQSDHLDTDADGDTIADIDERIGDYDRDGTPDFRDLDTDGDGIPDAIEAGDDREETRPVDTDEDDRPDFRDLDSDGDGIPDAEEDPNGNGVVDEGESSPTDADTDGDGTPDLVERAAGTDPNDPASDIPEGDFFFVLPFEGPEQEGTLDFSTDLRRSDLFFSVDTTGSFGEEIAEIQASISGQIVAGVDAVFEDAAYGVGRFEDFPLDPFGLAGDRPYEVLQEVTTIVDDVSAGVDLLPPAAGGLDTPESGIEALYQWATGAGFAAFGWDPAPLGIGGVGFRDGALPLVIQVTDARSHLPAEYVGFADDAHSEAEAVEVLNAIGARVIGICSIENEGTADDPRAELERLAIATNALVPAVGGECATGIDGAPNPAVDVGGASMCPLVFDVRTDGTGLGALIVDAIEQLATFGTIDISARAVGTRDRDRPAAIDFLPDGTTTADFITSIVPHPPAPDGAAIVGDVFVGVQPGSRVEFDLTAQNDFVVEIEELQLFTLDIEVVGDGVTVLDSRNVYVIVPQRIVEPEIK